MKIWISWAFSTGKTTILNLLKKEKILKNYFIQNELAREYLENNNLNAWELSLEWQEKLQNHIFANQVNIEQNNEKLIIDNTIFEGIAYSKWLKNYDKIYNKALVHYILNPYDIIFYIPPELNIENDWLRHVDKEFQTKIDNRIRILISKAKKINNNLKTFTITWTKDQRISSIIEVLKLHKT